MSYQCKLFANFINMQIISKFINDYCKLINVNIILLMQIIIAKKKEKKNKYSQIIYLIKRITIKK
jgi:hypothetical protein